MKLLGKLLGFGLMLLGIYWLGQNIVFTTRYSYWWQMPMAGGAVLLLLGGLWVLFEAQDSDRNFAWILIGGAIALTFASGGVMIRPTSLWNFLLGFSAMFGGFKLLKT
ncbi:hypothetical protein IQ266_17835 [filamentous cyanobacterium LEGE 11480]|uniref:Uncharacterized protein n=1 Tax=Romeriopsis navalis LEGE 11480 TaxID=2777977 RepID=A0A928VS82_9CYAN|nr:hypothetical protein [Romeriopsis navalis]MBE9031597.1 hypothetical protein [Romeriopsis navalis LEGE 11480]